MSEPQLSAAQLHEPILPLAQAPLVVFQPQWTVNEALVAVRATASDTFAH